VNRTIRADSRFFDQFHNRRETGPQKGQTRRAFSPSAAFPLFGSRLRKLARLEYIDQRQDQTASPADDRAARERAMRQFMRDRWAFLLVALVGAVWVAAAILEV
jgi:hypothetical protein